MSYMGNYFMPAVEAMPYPVIEELSKWACDHKGNPYDKKFLHDRWYEYYREAVDEWLEIDHSTWVTNIGPATYSNPEAHSFVTVLCDYMKSFLLTVIESDL